MAESNMGCIARDSNRNAASLVSKTASELTILSSARQDIDRAASILSSGGLLAFPTETVYGLGADARNGTAVAMIYEAKGRPSFNPLIVHVADVQMAQRFGVWCETAKVLAAAFWPGPLSLVLPLQQDHGLSSLVTAGLESVALRVPAHPAALAVLRKFDGPVAAPSANLSGRISPTAAQHVQQSLGSSIDAILDDGPCSVGLESTIVGLDAGIATLLRPGGIASKDIEAVLKTPLRTAAPDAISAPGQLLSHYAPNQTLRLNATSAPTAEAYLGFGEMRCDLNLSPSGDLHEAAANLFDYLHRLDAQGKPIAVAPVPSEGLGHAINDRLKRAAAPR